MKARTGTALKDQPSPETTSMKVTVGAGSSKKDVSLIQHGENDHEMNHQGLTILAKIIARSILNKHANPESK